jgi:hypothetical protein
MKSYPEHGGDGPIQSQRSRFWANGSGYQNLAFAPPRKPPAGVMPVKPLVSGADQHVPTATSRHVKNAVADLRRSLASELHQIVHELHGGLKLTWLPMVACFTWPRRRTQRYVRCGASFKYRSFLFIAVNNAWEASGTVLVGGTIYYFHMSGPRISVPCDISTSGPRSTSKCR